MKQEEKSFLSKGKIIDAAMKLFSEKGYENTTMQDLVQASGMSKGAIYHHFKSKQEIVAYLINEEKERFASSLRELASCGELTAREKIGRIIASLFSDATLSALAKEKWAEKVPFALLDTLRNSVNILSGCLEDILRQGVENGEFGCGHPRELAGVLVLLVDIWLDPVIADSGYQEMCEKVDFIALLADKFDAPVFDAELVSQVKEGLRHFYE
ncbi:MAG TPA: TetR/AcrR family transcriptional regulator [Candidatus Eisenbergiella merdavium]|uniref:TetR/AcrR family transcriptional regulator n=1 Tax=Candidatus Eisenbergiella merdavium TaxID=2838551 RepID=A0A9D2NHF1_9FIRM|nr:TetR/AcrR family transcriptional regulator [Candidatus Eisenbergiella merdavium]